MYSYMYKMLIFKSVVVNIYVHVCVFDFIYLALTGADGEIMKKGRGARLLFAH